MLYKKTLVALSLSALLISGCGSSSSDEQPSVEQPPQGFTFDASELITNLTTDIIVSGYDELNTKAIDFHLATLTLLNTPTEENLDAAQLAWQEVRVPWEQGEAHIFGPVDALSIDPHLDTWPLNTSDLQTLLATQSGFTATEIQVWNDDVQGFHTMEYLLFGDGVNDNHKSISELTVLEREYLTAAAEVFSGYTDVLYKAWTVAQDPSDINSPAYQNLLLTPDNDVYSSKLAVVQELINGMIGIVDEVANGKISDPFGTSIDTTDTSKVESQYSWNSLADFTNNIQGVQNVYLGRMPSQSSFDVGIYDFVKSADTVVADRIDNEISLAIESIKSIAGDNDMPFRKAINDVDGRVRIQAAIDALVIVQASLENDVLTLLNSWQTE